MPDWRGHQSVKSIRSVRQQRIRHARLRSHWPASRPRRGFPYDDSGGSTALVVDSADADAVSAAATLLAKLAVAGGRVLPIEVASPATVGQRNAIFVATPAQTPDEVLNQLGIDPNIRASWIGPAKLGPEKARGAGDVSVQTPPVEAGFAKPDQLDTQATFDRWRRELADGGSWRGNVSSFQDWFQRTFELSAVNLRFLPTADVAFQPTGDSAILLAQATNPTGDGAWTLLTAPSSSLLWEGAKALTAQRQWSQIAGHIVSYDGKTEALTTQAVTTFSFLPTQPFSIANLRLIAAKALREHFRLFSSSSGGVPFFGSCNCKTYFSHRPANSMRRARGGHQALLLAGALAFGTAMTISQSVARATAPEIQSAKPGTLPLEQWQPWRDRFVGADGRVIDDVNQVCHSEGQGYGQLLAVLAQDRAAFARIWSFTRSQLLVRDDGLAAWRWDAKPSPHITDINNASDGDILIAYSLALAGDLWRSPDLTTAAQDVAQAIGRVLIKRFDARTVLLPAAVGFGPKERPDGPVVNLSYWIFEALPVLSRLAPEADWSTLSTTGRELVLAARFGPAKLPANWISLHDASPTPAQGFDAQFGYDAVRVPLYLIRAGIADKSNLEPFAAAWQGDEKSPSIVNLADGRSVNRLDDPGYRMIAAAVACALSRKPIPADLKTPNPTAYYPSALRLLALSAIAQHYPECL
jgi:endoglucanase